MADADYVAWKKGIEAIKVEIDGDATLKSLFGSTVSSMGTLYALHRQDGLRSVGSSLESANRNDLLTQLYKRSLEHGGTTSENLQILHDYLAVEEVAMTLKRDNIRFNAN